MWEHGQWRPEQELLAKETQTEDELTRGWRHRWPLLVESAGSQIHAAITLTSSFIRDQMERPFAGRTQLCKIEQRRVLRIHNMQS